MTDSGVGAGIDSYYEYLMKAYILLGDKVYLNRFNTVRALCSPGIIMPLLVKQSLFYIYYLHIWLCLCLLWQHYSAIMKYISRPPLLLNVHMHNPTVNVRSWMDSLLAFFPGLQVHFFILLYSKNRDNFALTGWLSTRRLHRSLTLLASWLLCFWELQHRWN